MNYQRHYLEIRTSKKIESISITKKINELIQISNTEIGTCKLYLPHSTAALTINEEDFPEIMEDIHIILKELIDDEKRFINSNRDSTVHAKSTIVGCFLELPIDNKKLMLGRWQSIILCEFAGPKKRTVIIDILNYIN